jgi:hypothetical protein
MPSSPSLAKNYFLFEGSKAGVIAKFNFTDGSSYSLTYKNTGKKTADGKFDIYEIDSADWELDTKVISREAFGVNAYQDGNNFTAEYLKIKNKYKKTWKNKTIKSITTPKNAFLFSAPMIPGKELSFV